MGRDKAELVVAGERLADRAARVLQTVCDPVLEIGPGRSALEAVGDDDPHAGPLAALVTGAGALRPRGYEGAVLLLAVDLPFVDARLLELLVNHPSADSVVPVAGGMRQSCCRAVRAGGARSPPPTSSGGESARCMRCSRPCRSSRSRSRNGARSRPPTRWRISTRPKTSLATASTAGSVR